jgi:BirA family biotin operon repressor/biotin-[acetyl-CoA-carboxylase] ligase
MSTKNDVLAILEKNKGKSVSGSRMAMSLGVSRNSVWKAINALRKEGHVIEGGSGRGYVLAKDSDALSAEVISEIFSELSKEVCTNIIDNQISDNPAGKKSAYNMDVHVFDSIDSTNKEAKRLAISEPARTQMIVADQQTEGRGRLGRSFYSPKGSGLYISFLFAPTFSIGKATLATAAAAVAVARAIKKVSGKQCQIKWVNDVYYNDKKICGILTEGVTGLESRTIDYIIIGIGINCHPADLEENAGENAGDLGGGISRNQLAAQVANELLPLLDDLDTTDFLDYYREHSNVIGENIRIFSSGISSRLDSAAKSSNPTGSLQSGKNRSGDAGSGMAGVSGIPAKAIGIADNGGLEVEYADGRREVLTSGEITIRKDSSR